MLSSVETLIESGTGVLSGVQVDPDRISVD